MPPGGLLPLPAPWPASTRGHGYGGDHERDVTMRIRQTKIRELRCKHTNEHKNDGLTKWNKASVRNMHEEGQLVRNQTIWQRNVYMLTSITTHTHTVTPTQTCTQTLLNYMASKTQNSCQFW